MSLSLFVGMLIDLKHGDPADLSYYHDQGIGALTWYQDQFARINQTLAAKGLPLHDEPTEPRMGVPWSCQMYGYSGLHYLRRIAAHIASGLGLPPPGADRAVDDPILRGFYAQFCNPDRPKQFQHLIHHSDYDGYYLPLAFQDLILSDPALDVAGEVIGSATMLLQECEHLAGVLELPLDLDPESREVQDAVDWQGTGGVTWQRYGVESLTCLALYRACRVSLESGCAIVFA